MRDMVASCAAGYLDSTPLLDMNYIEDSGGGPDVAVAYHPNLDRVVLLQVGWGWGWVWGWGWGWGGVWGWGGERMPAGRLLAGC
jgi:hypothetical protein